VGLELGGSSVALLVDGAGVPGGAELSPREGVWAGVGGIGGTTMMRG